MFKRVVFCLCLSGILWSQQEDYNERGIDPRVDYNQLYAETTAIGIPWDDRNLGLTKEDLARLPPGDRDDTQNIPLWFRIMLRAQYPQIRDSGKGQYPRSAAEVYELFWGGEFRTKDFRGGPLVVNGEINITGTRVSAESAIAINPIDSDLMISGVNGPSGQEMWFSSDAGLTWTRSTSNLGSSCCDPTVGWSPDGTLAYMTQLGTCSNLCNIEFYLSNDNGQTWGNKVTVKGGGTNDKEYLHVDLHPSSPFIGNIYLHWHSFNTIEFARSTDNGANWDTPISFGGTNGIGGDIATDTNGKIYHLWPRTTNGSIRMNTSVDGGQTFSGITQVADTNAAFDYGIPVFDIRRAFIYVSVAVDLSNGPFKDRVYACWNDTDGPESGIPANNHSKITVIWSEDGGQNWNEVTPHPTNNIQTVDRFNPWLDVDATGRIHVTYASTINDPNRRVVDIYHVFSEDGGVSWSTPQRITATSSPYLADGFQWGDYNGMALQDGKVRPIWTDSRSGKRVFTADAEFSIGNGDFALGTANGMATICANQDAPDMTIDVTALNGFSGTVTFDFDPPLPTGINGMISGSPVSVPGQITVSLSAAGNAPEGTTPIRVLGTSGLLSHDINLNLKVLTLSTQGRAALWLDANNYNADYDFNSDQVINLIDLVDSLNFCSN